jgi:hypothetical protein
MYLATGTFLDGYSLDRQFANIMNEGFDRNSPQALRDRTMSALSHFGLLRGENTRGIQLPDLQFLSLDEQEGPSLCDVMVILLLNGKTNQEGRTQYMGAMRNKDWRCCPMGALAMWLFYR